MKLIDIEKISEIFVSDVMYTGNEIMEILNKQPEAYDIERVVVNLKIRSEEYNSGVRLHGRLQEMLTDDAVYIVRAGYTL